MDLASTSTKNYVNPTTGPPTSTGPLNMDLTPTSTQLYGDLPVDPTFGPVTGALLLINSS